MKIKVKYESKVDLLEMSRLDTGVIMNIGGRSVPF